MRTSAIGLALACATALCARADFVTERWGQGERCRHSGTVRFQEVAAGGRVAAFDLSALPKAARVYRARLLLTVATGPGPLAEPLLVQPLTAPWSGKGEPAVEAEPLALLGPRFRSHDATQVVRRWVSGKLANHGLWVRNAPGWKPERTILEVSYEGKLTDPHPPASNLRAFHRAGQVFLTFEEVNSPFTDPFGAKAEVTWNELSTLWQRMREGKVPQVAYRIYRHGRRITAGNLHEATLLDEVPQFSVLDERQIKTEWKGERIKNVRVGTARVPRVCVEPLKELPLGTGVFVRTTAKAGSYHYAVVAAVDGVENTVQLNAQNSLAEPVRETVATPEPVLHHETEHIYDRPRRHRFYLLWTDPPLSKTPDFYHMGVTFPPGPPKEPAPLYVHAFWWDNGWARSGARRAIPACISLQMETPWVLHKGIHEGTANWKAWSQGTVQDYWMRRLRAVVPWLAREFHVDPERMYAMSSGWAWHHPDLFAAVHENLTTNPRRSPTSIGSDRFWGKPDAPAKTEWGISAWDYYDTAGFLKKHVELEIPFVYYTPNMHEGDFGFIDKPRFYRAMLDTKRAFMAAWGMQVDASWIYSIGRAAPMAAFANCSLDANPGIGMGDGDREGQINGYLRFDPATALDQPDRWEMTVWLFAGDERGRYRAPADSCTVDITPRRCQRFRLEPGQKFRWSSALLEGNAPPARGTGAADQWGLATIRQLTVTQEKRRIAIQR